MNRKRVSHWNTIPAHQTVTHIFDLSVNFDIRIDAKDKILY